MLNIDATRIAMCIQFTLRSVGVDADVEVDAGTEDGVDAAVDAAELELGMLETP